MVCGAMAGSGKKVGKRAAGGCVPVEHACERSVIVMCFGDGGNGNWEKRHRIAVFRPGRDLGVFRGAKPER
jgi:hypothetical protein